jgi:hypothetical protein
MRVTQDLVPFFAIGDRDDLGYEQKLAAYRRLADAHFQTELYAEFCAEALPHLDELALEWFGSPKFDALLVEVVTATFPPHEHEEMVERHRALVGQWVRERTSAGHSRE